MRNNLTAEYVRSLFDYNPETGVFTRRVGPYRRPSWAGRPVGNVQNKGYITIRVNDKAYLAHRLAWLHVHGNWPVAQIDHINGIKSDNRLSNLREATNSENHCNKGLQSNNTSGVKGVWWSAEKRKWSAEIKLNRKRYRLGYFASLEEARAARMAATERLHGEFARPA